MKRRSKPKTEQPYEAPVRIMHNGPFEHTYPMPKHGWTCFHCGETFTKIGAARDHFGETPISTPGCCLRPLTQDEKAILFELRRTEKLLRESQKELASVRERESGTPLFKCGDFISHSGLKLSDKIDCDALTAEDWKAQAKWFSDRIGFGKVVGVPSGGLKFAEALEEYCSPFGPMLIVDDVLTTGKSMEEARLEFPDAVGAVLFSRTANVPKWITARFIETTRVEDGATK